MKNRPDFEPGILKNNDKQWTTLIAICLILNPETNLCKLLDARQ